MGYGMMKKPVDSIQWQDYRASNTGMIVYYASDPVSEVPVREIPEEIDSPIVPEPNYENRVYGFYGCIRPKIRNAFFKSKIRYLFFLTKYAGTREDFKDKFMITGFFRIHKTADVQKLHLRYIPESSCMDTDNCIALRSDDAHFVALEDAFLVDDEKLKSWGYHAKINKQLRIVLDAEKTSQLLEYLKSKPGQLEAYVKETKRLEPHEETEELLEDDMPVADAAGLEPADIQGPEENAPDSELTETSAPEHVNAQGPELPETPAPDTNAPTPEQAETPTEKPPE
jgi:hypothetical protein